MNNDIYKESLPTNESGNCGNHPPEKKLIEYHNRLTEDYVSGLTMPLGIPITGNLVAWNDYCETLAYMQLGANNDNSYDSKYKKCLDYFMSSYQKMNIMRLLYLQNSVDAEYTKAFICARLNLSRSFVHRVIDDGVAEGWIINDTRSIKPTQHSIEAFRHYAMRWWLANENSGLSGQYFRVWHSRNAVFVKDKIRNQYLQNVGGAV